jgi:uncharacterized membrane protein
MLLLRAALVVLEGAALVVLAVQIFRWRALEAFLLDNRIEPAAERHLLAAMLSGGVCVLSLGLYRARRRSQLLRELDWLSRLLAPLLVAALLPALARWRLWERRPLTLLLLSAGCLALLERTLVTSGRALLPALGGHPLLGRLRRTLGAVTPAWLPLALVVLAIAGYLAYVNHYTLLNHARLNTSIFDLGFFDQLFWNTLHGQPFYAPSAHVQGGSYLAQHAELVIFLFLPFYALAPRAETLLTLQTVLCALSALPLYLLARQRLGSRWLAALLAVALLLYPPLHGPNFYDFHFLTLSVFFVLWAAYFLSTERWPLFWLMFACCLGCREDVALGLVFACGALALSSPRHFRIGAVGAAVAAAYFLVLKLLIMPRFGGETFLFVYRGLLAPGQDGFGGVLRTVLANPIYTLTSLMTPQKLELLLAVLVPVALLPLRRPRLLGLLLPGAVVTLLSTGYAPVVSIRFQYVTHFTPYVFIAAVLALEWIGTARGWLVRAASAVAVAAGTLVATANFGALSQHHFYSGFGKVEFHITAAERARLGALEHLAGTIPVDASVAATHAEGAHLAGRRDLFALRHGAQHADYILFSSSSLADRRALSALRRALGDVDDQYGIAAEEDEITLLARHGPATGRDALAERLDALAERVTVP